MKNNNENLIVETTLGELWNILDDYFEKGVNVGRNFSNSEDITNAYIQYNDEYLERIVKLIKVK